MSVRGLSPEERESYERKKRTLDRMVAERKISRAEAKDRMAQSLADRASLGRAAGAHGGELYDRFRRASSKRKLPNTYLLTLMEPERYMSAVPDPFSLFPRTIERIKTSFTMSADANGMCGIRLTAGNTFATVNYGTATVNGATVVAGGSFSPFKWATFNNATGGAATEYRRVATKIVIEYEGPLTDSAGRVACCEYPPDGGVSFQQGYDDIASYDYSYSGPVAKGAMQIHLPSSTNSTTEFFATSTTLNSTSHPMIVFAAAGLTGGGVPPAGDTRLNITIFEVYEFYSVDPILTGGQKHSPPMALADHAGQILGTVAHHEKGLNGKAKHGHNTGDTIMKYWKKYTWDQRHWMWDLTKTYGPYVADFAIDLALAA